MVENPFQSPLEEGAKSPREANRLFPALSALVRWGALGFMTAELIVVLMFRRVIWTPRLDKADFVFCLVGFGFTGFVIVGALGFLMAPPTN